jgi:hypothetical protein
MSSTMQNLSGVWVGNGGAEATLAGGPAEYHGTWQNQNGDFHGAGTIHFKVIDASVIWVTAEGIITHAGTQAAWKDSGNIVRE